MRLAAISLALCLASIAPAHAQSANNSNNGQHLDKSNPAQSGSKADVSQKLQSDLQRAGFSDVQVTPESFLVRAKDKNGRPVTMLVHPAPITAMAAPSEEETTGSGASKGGEQSPGAGQGAK
jgi:hypothetical protein